MYHFYSKLSISVKKFKNSSLFIDNQIITHTSNLSYIADYYCCMGVFILDFTDFVILIKRLYYIIFPLLATTDVAL